MQTILGAGGVIGNELSKALTSYTNDIRLVSRNPKKVNDTDLLFRADLTDARQVSKAVEGSEIAYLTVGLPYNTKVWAETWPVVMQHVIDACVEHHCKLVFFDNIYLYDGKDLDPIIETTQVNPPSKKGIVRKQIVDMLWHAVKHRGLKALIARSADFYGPSIQNASMLAETVIKPLIQNKTANWFVNINCKHSFTYTIDAARATAILGNTPDAYNETWHLPTAKNPPTGKEWIELIAAELNTTPRYRTVSKMMMWMLGLFVPIMHESYEMLYQYDKDYVFNSDKFERRFSFKPTPYLEGIKEIIRADYRK